MPLLVLIEAAKAGDERGVEEYAQVFTEHANKLVEVSATLFVQVYGSICTGICGSVCTGLQFREGGGGLRHVHSYLHTFLITSDMFLTLI